MDETKPIETVVGRRADFKVLYFAGAIFIIMAAVFFGVSALGEYVPQFILFGAACFAVGAVCSVMAISVQKMPKDLITVCGEEVRAYDSKYKRQASRRYRVLALRDIRTIFIDLSLNSDNSLNDGGKKSYGKIIFVLNDEERFTVKYVKNPNQVKVEIYRLQNDSEKNQKNTCSKLSS